MTEQIHTFGNGPADEEQPAAAQPVAQQAPAPVAAPAHAQPEPQVSQLDEIAAEFDAIDPEENLVKFVVEVMPTLEVEFNCHMTGDEIQRLRRGASASDNRANRRARRGAQGQDVDEFKLATSLLREKSTGIFHKGKVVKYDNTELTLNDPKFLEWIKTLKSAQKQEIHTLNDAVEFLIGAGYMLRLADEIMNEAGFGGEAIRADPK